MVAVGRRIVSRVSSKLYVRYSLACGHLWIATIPNDFYFSEGEMIVCTECTTKREKIAMDSNNDIYQSGYRKGFDTGYVSGKAKTLTMINGVLKDLTKEIKETVEARLAIDEKLKQ